MKSAILDHTIGEAKARSIKDLRAFFALQAPLVERAEKALRDGYPIEASEIAQNQMHAVLRKALWMKSILEAANSVLGRGDDDYLLRLLTRPSDMMPLGVSGRELYGAAARFALIDETTATALNHLQEESATLLRQAFTTTDQNLLLLWQKLGKYAEEFVRIDALCIAMAERTLENFEEQMAQSA